MNQAPKIPADDLIIDVPHGTVVFEAKQPRLYVQAIDSYGYQRELNVSNSRVAGTLGRELTWEYHAYQHRLTRNLNYATEQVAKRFVARFMDLVTNYQILLFNHGSASDGRNAGFVRLTDKLLHGEPLSVKLLN